jgi:hypothetical protein
LQQLYLVGFIAARQQDEILGVQLDRLWRLLGRLSGRGVRAWRRYGTSNGETTRIAWLM